MLDHKSLQHLRHACHEFAPKITVIGVGGAGGNAVNNMIVRGLTGVEFLVCNTDAQHIATTLTENRLQLGRDITQGRPHREERGARVDYSHSGGCPC